MQTASTTRVIRTTPEKIWALVENVTYIERWHPSVAKADLLSEKPTGLGATRRCNFYDKTSVREEVIACDAGKRIRLRLTEFSVPMQRLEAEFRLSPGAEGTTEVTFEISYVVKFGVVGKLLGATVIRREMTKMASKVLAGLDHHAVTGKVVDQNFVPLVALA